MTCRHVIDVIDAGPFVDHPGGHMEAARAHAGRCEACGRALQLSEALTAGLEAMPLPGPSRDLTQSVLARIATIDQRVPRAEVAQIQTAQSAEPKHRPWLPTLGAIAAAAAIVIVTVTESSSEGSVAPSLGLRMGMLGTSGTLSHVLASALGVTLYVFGLCAAGARHGRSNSMRT